MIHEIVNIMFFDIHYWPDNDRKFHFGNVPNKGNVVCL